MKLIVGLGNPGKKYESTRHNIGFMVIDQLCKVHQLNIALKSKFKGELVQGMIKNETIVLLKPQTYMNLSGESVLAVKNFYNIENKDILVIYDDLDLETGKIRFRQKGSAGGHNGIKSIISCLNSETFHRLKIGIDRDDRIDVVNYVLGKFTKQQIQFIDDAMSQSINAVEDWVTQDITFVMNKYN